MNEEKEPKEEQGQKDKDSGREEAEAREKESSPEPEETEEKKQEGSSGGEKEKDHEPEDSTGEEEPEGKERENSSGQEESEEQEEKSGPEPEESAEEETESTSGGEKAEAGKPEDIPEEKEPGEGDPEKEKKQEEIPEPESEPLLRHFSSGLRFLLAGILVCAIVYPGVLLLAGKAFWKDKSEGGLVRHDGKTVGARLIGQRFTSAQFFHPRPSSKGYNGMNSGSQNLGPYNEALTGRVASRLEELRREGIAPGDVPAGWVTESGSALDPHITPSAALLQLPRVSRASGLPESELKKMIDEHTEGKLMGLYGQERVNVLLLNLDIQKRLGGSK